MCHNAPLCGITNINEYNEYIFVLIHEDSWFYLFHESALIFTNASRYILDIR